MQKVHLTRLGEVKLLDPIDKYGILHHYKTFRNNYVLKFKNKIMILLGQRKYTVLKKGINEFIQDYNIKREVLDLILWEENIQTPEEYKKKEDNYILRKMVKNIDKFR